MSGLSSGTQAQDCGGLRPSQTTQYGLTEQAELSSDLSGIEPNTSKYGIFGLLARICLFCRPNRAERWAKRAMGTQLGV